MGILEQFLAYATDFEATYADDDWSRLEQYFAPDAVYTVEIDGPMACRLVGPEAILRGMKKSLDGLDRRFDSRTIEVLGAPEVEADELRVHWAATYTKAGLPPLRLEGRSRARYADGVIAELVDGYAPGPAADEAAAWLAEHGAGFDGSYE